MSYQKRASIQMLEELNYYHECIHQQTQNCENKGIIRDGEGQEDVDVQTQLEEGEDYCEIWHCIQGNYEELPIIEIWFKCLHSKEPTTE